MAIIGSRLSPLGVADQDRTSLLVEGGVVGISLFGTDAVDATQSWRSTFG